LRKWEKKDREEVMVERVDIPEAAVGDIAEAVLEEEAAMVAAVAEATIEDMAEGATADMIVDPIEEKETEDLHPWKKGKRSMSLLTLSGSGEMVLPGLTILWSLFRVRTREIK